MSSNSSSSLPSSLFGSPDYYYVALLDTTTNVSTILMHAEQEQWCLPYFEYPEALNSGTTIPIVCDDFKSWLQITTDDVHFTGTVELLGDRCYYSRITPKDLGRVQLLVVEPQGIAPNEIKLPNGAGWKQADFVPIALPPLDSPLNRIMGRAIQQCMDRSSYFLHTCSDKRHQLGWFEKASRYLTEVVSSQGAEIRGHVVQRHMACTSTMLRLDSSLGSYFLKSPTRGCNEPGITAAVAELFPETCPVIVGVSKHLNCFVSEEFDDDGAARLRDAVMALAKLQLQSVEHIKRLSDAGCPVRDLDEFREAMKDWPQIFEDFNLDASGVEKLIVVIEDLCVELKKYNIPMTLVHGDFSLTNVGFRKQDGRKGLIVFDWEYAYIGHPFFDFHRIYKEVPNDVLDEYLGLWSEYEGIDGARNAYRIGKKLGLVMKAWSYLEWAVACHAQDPPFLSSLAINTAMDCYAKISP